jgi:hypothetical protein
MVRASVYAILALRRREGSAFRDRAAHVAVAKQEVAHFGLIDMRAQAEAHCALRTDTPTQVHERSRSR